ncbi:MAG TPA: aldo/keto reductase [Levilinea sp.]|nr:aldo/keto reductase [Levilinea sp.]
MHYRQLGRTGMIISEIGFGAWGIGGGWGQRDDGQARQALQRALELGINFFDTALGYGDGHSERLIGQEIAGQRDRVVIATKIPPKTFRWPVLPGEPVSETFPTAWVIECTERSLKNLNVDYIDVQQLHAWSPAYLAQLDWYEGLMRLKQQGKIRAFGVSANDWDPYGTVDLVNSGLIDTIQVIYNIFEQRPAERLLPAALGNNAGVIVRVPFEEGLLTGKMGPEYTFEDGDWRASWLTPERLAEARSRVDALAPFLNQDCPDYATLALKFVLSHPAVSTVIPGMRTQEHVEANASASGSRLLTRQEVEALHEHAFLHGWSYPWAQEQS